MAKRKPDATVKIVATVTISFKERAGKPKAAPKKKSLASSSSEEEAEEGASKEEESIIQDEGEEAELTPAKKTKQDEPAAETMDEQEEKNMRTLFVRNLPFSVTDDQMFETFSPYGKCECRLIMDRECGAQKGIMFGWVKYATAAEMKAALVHKNGIYIGDRQAFIKCANDPAMTSDSSTDEEGDADAVSLTPLTPPDGDEESDEESVEEGDAESSSSDSSSDEEKR